MDELPAKIQKQTTMRPLIFLYFIFGVTQLAIAQTNDVDILKKLNSDFGTSIVRRDAETLSRILSDDFVMINAKGERLTKKDNLEMVASSTIEFTSLKIDSVNVRLITPDVGVVNCWQTFRYKVDGKEQEGRNCYQERFKQKYGLSYIIKLDRLRFFTIIQR